MLWDVQTVVIRMLKLVVILLLLGAVAASADQPSSYEFSKDGLSINVVPVESDFDDSRAYQVVVENELRTFSRLQVNRDGIVSDAWLTDLDGDGAFEVIVATSQLGGGDNGALDIHEWDNFQFESTIAKLPADVGYAGNDQFALENGRLTRAFPVFGGANGGNVRLPSGEMARFVYDFGAKKWLRIAPKP